jgi:hypothetical protein
MKLSEHTISIVNPENMSVDELIEVVRALREKCHQLLDPFAKSFRKECNNHDRQNEENALIYEGKGRTEIKARLVVCLKKGSARSKALRIVNNGGGVVDDPCIISELIEICKDRSMSVTMVRADGVLYNLDRAEELSSMGRLESMFPADDNSADHKPKEQKEL